ncbi:MAG: thiamine pyrophosphate-dependent dehydrogenase E1 component subunit alpha [Thermoleophilaceae bacterium]
MTAVADTREAMVDARLVGSFGEPRDARLYRRMCFIRRFEETLLALFEQGVLNGTTHACIGQEANGVGLMEHLRDGDHLFSNHRCHGHFLAWTGDAPSLLAEIMGKPAGVCSGIGGSQHICAPGFKSNGIQGGIVPAAAGIALAEQLRGSDGLSVVFLGDGTLGEGVVYETLNLSALWQLPLLVVLEDNGWAQSTPRTLNLAGDIAPRFEAFGLPVVEVDTTDVLEIDAAADEAVSGCRTRRSPGVLIIHTYRLCHHSKNDDNRPVEEVQARWAFDPLVVHGARLTEDERADIEGEVNQALDECVGRVLQL